MKLKEMPNTCFFLEMMFGFFIANNFKFILGEEEDIPKLLNAILESEYIRYSSVVYTYENSVWFRINRTEQNWDVNMIDFIPANQDILEKSVFIVDLVSRANEHGSCFSLQWDLEKKPPFFLDFLDENNQIIEEDENGDVYCLTKDSIMDFTEFRGFLNKKYVQTYPITIEVD